jgi:hypothetical protein
MVNVLCAFCASGPAPSIHLSPHLTVPLSQKNQIEAVIIRACYFDHRGEKLMNLVPKQEKANADNSYAPQALLNATAALTVAILMPTMGLCSSMGQVWHLVLMGAVVTVGTIFGLLLHKRLEQETVVQIPFTYRPNVPRNGRVLNFKKAA